MKRHRFALALLLYMAAAHPALAQNSGKTHAAAPLDAQFRDIRAQMTAYGEWTIRLNDAGRAANEELVRVQTEWSALSRNMSSAAAAARFRPILARAREKVTEARARVLVLDTPTFPKLELTDDLQPAAMVEQMVKLLDQITVLLDSFGPLLDAMTAGDKKAVEQSGTQMLDAGRLLLETQALFVNAGLVTTDKESGIYEVQLFQERYFRSTARIIVAAKTILFGRADPTIGKDLDAFATEIFAISQRGRMKLNTEIAEMEAAIANSGASRDPDAINILQKTIAVLRIDLQLLDSADGYAAALRVAAAKAHAGQLGQSGILVLMQDFRKVRDDIVRISAEEAQAMAVR